MTRVLAPIVFHAEVNPGYYRMRLVAPAISTAARAGQFVHVLPRPATSFDPLLRRAFSILAADGEVMDILYRVEGRGTSQMALAGVGDKLDVLGPLGQSFAPVQFRALLVGGGVGVPPLAMMAAQERRTPVKGIPTSRKLSVPTLADKNSLLESPSADTGDFPELEALVGARTREELICLEDFERSGVPVRVATDDGSSGLHGFVTELLQERLRALSSTGALQHPVPPTVYACGPLAMLRAVAAICEAFAVPCQVSLEENMPCGVGVCNGCVVRAKTSADDYGQYRRICVEGPVMWSHEISW